MTHQAIVGLLKMLPNPRFGNFVGAEEKRLWWEAFEATIHALYPINDSNDEVTK